MAAYMKLAGRDGSLQKFSESIRDSQGEPLPCGKLVWQQIW